MSDRSGFSLVELVVAMLILTVGLLGMAGATAYVIQRTALSELDTQRAAALQGVIETLRARPFDEVESGERTLDALTVEWESDPSGATDQRTKMLTIVVGGPGRRVGSGSRFALSATVVDTFTYRLIRRDP